MMIQYNPVAKLPNTLIEYLWAQMACQIEIDDIVRVVRKAESYEHGWGQKWVTIMDDAIGRTFRVSSKRSDYGTKLNIIGSYSMGF